MCMIYMVYEDPYFLFANKPPNYFLVSLYALLIMTPKPKDHPSK